jgi:MoaA/NifB/PqqE/SkfB family radical SAM enzyme
MVIYENGDVYPCEIMGYKFGNLRDVDYDVKKLLFSLKGRKIIEKIQQKKPCYCTWENIISVNLLFSPLYYPRILYEWFRLFARGRQDR